MSAHPANHSVYVDFDDVLCETARAIIRVVEREFGKTIAFEAIFSFNLAESFDLSPSELAHLMDLVHAPDVLMTMQPIEGALVALETWVARGVAVVVVSGRPPSTEPVCRQWLAEHAVPYRELVLVDKYARPHPPREDVRVRSLDELSAMPFDLAVEDAPRMIGFLAEHTAIPVAVLDRPWNRALDAGIEQRVVRCLNWPAVLARFPLAAAV